MPEKLFVAALYASKTVTHGRTVDRSIFVDSQYILAPSLEDAEKQAKALLYRWHSFALGWRSHYVEVREIPKEIIAKAAESQKTP